MTGIKRLTEAEYTDLSRQCDPVFGQGHILYVTLCRQLHPYQAAPSVAEYWQGLREVQENYSKLNNTQSFAELLPSYAEYASMFDALEASATPPARTPRVRRPAATPPAPAGGGRTTNPRVDPLGVDPLDDPDDDFDDAPIAPVTSRPARPVFAPQGEEPTWLADYDRRAVQPLYDITDDHENRLSDLEARPAGAGFGFSAPVGFIAGAIAALLAWLVLALLVHVVGTTLVVLIGLAFVAFFLVGGFAAAGVSVPRATRRA